MSQQDYFLILDYETTGAPDDKILEVAWQLVDTELNSRHQIMSRVVWQPIVTLDAKVLAMHTANGLLAEVAQSKITIEMAEQDIINTLPNPMVNPEVRITLMGYSCHYDRRIMTRDMPKLHARLHYRHMDMSVPRGMYHHWTENLPRNTNLAHRATDDVQSVYNVATTFRDIFKTLPKGLREKGLYI
jgi:oligoribonuclease (3'-5' exoribonuclease)